MGTRFWNIAIPTFLFLLGLFFFAKSYGYCEQYRLPASQEYLFATPDAQSHFASKSMMQKSVTNQRQFWQDEFDMHHFNAIRTYEDAKNRAWYLPDLTWRQRAREAWMAAFATIGAQTPQLKLVLFVSSLLCNYGLDCLDEWDYINDKLKWSQYHFEKCGVYAALLAR